MFLKFSMPQYELLNFQLCPTPLQQITVVTILGSSHGFDPSGSTSGYVLWVNGKGVMIDPPPNSTTLLKENHIYPSMITAIIVTHCHADHDAGTFQKILQEGKVTLITTTTIFKSFCRKYSALAGLDVEFLKQVSISL
jgi:metal-dependent hydrolase (beta-lactamase superfamily II)